jgi:hypothetical protein
MNAFIQFRKEENSRVNEREYASGSKGDACSRVIGAKMKHRERVKVSVLDRFPESNEDQDINSQIPIQFGIEERLHHLERYLLPKYKTKSKNTALPSLPTSLYQRVQILEEKLIALEQKQHTPIPHEEKRERTIEQSSSNTVNCDSTSNQLDIDKRIEELKRKLLEKQENLQKRAKSDYVNE